MIPHDAILSYFLVPRQDPKTTLNLRPRVIIHIREFVRLYDNVVKLILEILKVFKKRRKHKACNIYLTYYTY